MIFLFVIPMTTGAFGNYLIPLMIGARDMAFPRMNALSFWIFVAVRDLHVHRPGRRPGAGRRLVQLRAAGVAGSSAPGASIDFYALGLIFNAISSTAAAVNFIVTIFKLRAPGMSINRMPLFCYAFLAVVLRAGLRAAAADRRAGSCSSSTGGSASTSTTSRSGGEPLLWQHLFWIFGHPEVYIIILPAFGIATSIIPTFTRRRMVAFPLVALAEILVAFIGFGVWVAPHVRRPACRRSTTSTSPRRA